MATDQENVRALADGIHELNVNSSSDQTTAKVKTAVTALAGGAGGGGTTLTEDPERPGIFLINGA